MRVMNHIFKSAVNHRALKTHSEIEDHDRFLILHVDLPDVREEDVSLDLERRNVVLSVRSRPPMKFRIPADVDSNCIEAVFFHGGLRIMFPKLSCEEHRKIGLRHIDGDLPLNEQMPESQQMDSCREMASCIAFEEAFHTAMDVEPWVGRLAH